jgi:hypothetical protein
LFDVTAVRYELSVISADHLLDGWRELKLIKGHRKVSFGDGPDEYGSDQKVNATGVPISASLPVLTDAQHTRQSEKEEATLVECLPQHNIVLRCGKIVSRIQSRHPECCDYRQGQ